MRENWTYKKIGDLCNIKTGKLDANAANKNGKYPFFTCSKEPMSINTYAYDCECVLIAGNGDLNVKYYNGKFNAYQRTYILNLKEEIDDITIPYIYDFFLLYVDELRRKSIGGIIKYIKLGDLANAKIPVPSLSEQQSIVAELDKINELISLKKVQLSDLDTLAQSIFYDMFGDPIENEKGWEVKKLGEVGIIGDGLHGTPQYDDNGDCYFINGNNLENGNIIITKATKRVNEIEKVKYYIEFTNNTLLVSINGTLGKVAFYNNENIILGKSACYIILNTDINKTFIYNIIKSRYFLEYMKNEYTGSTIKNISLKSMRNLPIPLPPLSLQQDFAKRIELIEQQKAQISSTIKDLETLLASRMQYWFD